MPASVKVMRSYDYCHFEISKSTDENLSDEQIDAMRKDCQRLADKAVRQYQIAKGLLSIQTQRKEKRDRLRREVDVIKNKAEGDRTPNEQAKVKLIADRDWERYISERYDYQDDWQDYQEHGQ